MHTISLVSDADSDKNVASVLMKLLPSEAPPSSGFVTMPVSVPHCVVKCDRLSPHEDRLREGCCHEALAFPRHTIKLELDEEIMKAREANKLGNRSKYHINEAMVPEKAPTETDRPSFHAREPIEDDERLAMRRGDMSSPLPERVASPRNSRRPSSTGLPTELGKCTVPPSKTPTQEHGLTISEVSFHNL